MDMDGEVGEVWGEGNSVRGTGYEIEGVRLCVASMLFESRRRVVCLLLNRARVPRTFTLLTKTQKGVNPARVTRNNKTIVCCFGFRHTHTTTHMDIQSVLAIFGSVSPSLAAYHHIKFQKHLDPARCSRCGHQLLPGTSHTRLVRSDPTSKPKRRHKGRRSDPIVHSIEQTCATCGHVNNTPLHHPISHLLHNDKVTTPPPLVETVGPHTLRTDQCLPSDPTPVPSPSPSHHHPPRHSFPSPPAPASPQPQLQTRPKKSRPKHKAGLQDMLARNKDRQRKDANTTSSGLATFLHTL